MNSTTKTEVKAGEFLVLAIGSAGEIERAHGILGTTGAAHLSAQSARVAAMSTSALPSGSSPTPGSRWRSA